jgi:hypothetical protein
VYAVGADSTAQMKPVTVGLTIGETTVIDKGVDGGEQVIIEGQNQVRPGGKVASTSQAGDAASPAPGQGKPGQQGQPDHRRGKRGAAEGADPASAAGSAGAGDGTRRPPSNDAAPGASAVRPAGGQSRPRGPATGPTASTQTPAAP